MGVIFCRCIHGFLCSPGEYDALPEQAFYMVGAIEEVIEKAARLEKEHGS